MGLLSMGENTLQWECHQTHRQRHSWLLDVEVYVGLSPDHVDGLVGSRVYAAALYGVILHVPQTVPDLGHVLRGDLDHETVLHDRRLRGEAARRFEGAVEDDETRTGNY